MEALETSSEADTVALGERLAGALRPGDVLLLHGDLGAGKTALVRGIARGLGLRSEEVTSPTFTLIQEYGGEPPLFHVDLYRLEAPDVDDLGLDEMIEGGGIVAVEWPERWRTPPAGAYEIHIAHAGDERRAITIVRPGDASYSSR